MLSLNITHPAVITCLADYPRFEIKLGGSPFVENLALITLIAESLLARKELIHPLAPQMFAGEILCVGAEPTLSSHASTVIWGVTVSQER